MKHRQLKRLPVVKITSLVTVFVMLLVSCGGNNAQPQEQDLTDDQIAEILPEFDFGGLVFTEVIRNYYSERYKDTIPVIINYLTNPAVDNSFGNMKILSETPRQCLGGINPISRSFEEAMVEDGWTIDSLVSFRSDSGGSRNVEIFRKSNYVVTVNCDAQVSYVDGQLAEGQWGSILVRRPCLINGQPSVQITLSFDSVPKEIMGYASEKGQWLKTSFKDLEPMYLDDALRFDGGTYTESSIEINDYASIPFSKWGEFPITPDDTVHGPIRACKYDEASSEWVVPE
jgi:hypothetical protein